VGGDSAGDKGIWAFEQVFLGAIDFWCWGWHSASLVGFWESVFVFFCLVVLPSAFGLVCGKSGLVLGRRCSVLFVWFV
jgi:hypothetical protein